MAHWLNGRARHAPGAPWPHPWPGLAHCSLLTTAANAQLSIAPKKTHISAFRTPHTFRREFAFQFWEGVERPYFRPATCFLPFLNSSSSFLFAALILTSPSLALPSEPCARIQRKHDGNGRSLITTFGRSLVTRVRLSFPLTTPVGDLRYLRVAAHRHRPSSLAFAFAFAFRLPQTPSTQEVRRMDDTARLVSELQGKLAELNDKVAAYQRDMLAQFHRHMEECLKKYPDHVSNEVSRVIAASMSQHPALCPTRPDDDLGDAERAVRTGRKSPPPILYHTSGKPKEGPRSPSPREREEEFRGIFIPRFLPLLDKSCNPLQSPPASPATAPLLTPPLQPAEKVEEPKLSEATVEPSLRPAAPIRRSTDRSMSIDSSGSESKVRRSALRRSSSSSKGGGRRHVRFDFEGTEVLPSTSPQEPVPDPSPADEAETPEPQPQSEPQLEAAVADASVIVTEHDESQGMVLSLLDVEGEEDSLPRPKKVSSTLALQALSRSPLDAGTTWTVVNADPEEALNMTPAKDAVAVLQTDGQEQPLALSRSKVKPAITVRLDDAPVDNPRIDALLGSPIEELEEYHDEDDSDEEFLSMSTKFSRKTPSPVVPQLPFGQLPPPAKSQSMFQSLSRSAAAPAPEPESSEEDGDPLFDLDDEENRAQAAGQTQKYLPDDEEEEEEVTPVSERLRDHQRNTTAQTPMSPSGALLGLSFGSYKGKQLSINPVGNLQLYDEIASMKDVHFVVGSTDGRSGIDPIDAASYRAGLVRHVGTPRSFTERLALEEAVERQRDDGE